MVPSLKGCQIVAGDRSVAQTTGRQTKMIFHPEKGGRKRWHPSRVLANCSARSGGLRYAPTTGYYLTAFQAEILSRNCWLAVSLSELKSI